VSLFGWLSFIVIPLAVAALGAHHFTRKGAAHRRERIIFVHRPSAPPPPPAQEHQQHRCAFSCRLISNAQHHYNILHMNHTWAANR
jgi:hypothetical protein